MKQLIRFFIGGILLISAAAGVGLYYLHVRAQRATAFKFVPRAEKIVKIPEGWTNQDIADYLAKLGPWPSADFLSLAGSAQADYAQSLGRPATASITATSTDFVEQFSFLADKPDQASLEGYLFPDTYRVYASSTSEEIISKMLTNFNEKLTPQMRADIKAQGKTIYDIVTMASIIEKEAPINYQTNDNHDAKIISGIFWHRLKIGQALQSDATISYILHDSKTRHSGADLTVDSPYNTYKYSGLPPGPIGNPGILAITAAIYPQTSDYNYFLTTPGTDRVIYARTYAEHLQNKYKYLP